MAIAGGGIPSFPVSLVGGRVKAHSFATNKPAHLVEQDIERAARRQIEIQRENLATVTGEERRQMRQEIYRLSADWWREVRR